MAQGYSSPRFCAAVPETVYYQSLDVLDQLQLQYQVSQMFCSSLSHLDPYFNAQWENQNLAIASLYGSHQFERASCRHEQLQRPKLKLVIDADTNFQCLFKGCGRTFYCRDKFKKHSARHNMNQYRPFACSFHGCIREFSRKIDLQRHQNCVHKKERKHSCIFCCRSFTRKDSLQR